MKARRTNLKDDQKANEGSAAVSDRATPCVTESVEKTQGKEAIDDRLKRINLKSKRKRTLLKKIIEMSQMCKLDMFLVIHDQEMNKVIEYNSGSQHLGTLFNLEKASEMVHLARDKKLIHKLLNDDIY